MSKDDILRILLQSRDGYRSGADLAARLGVSRAAVWKHIKTLQREGYGITAVPSKGYRLDSQPDRIVGSEVREGLAAKLIGRRIERHDEIPSTNTRALELAQQGEGEGTVVVTEAQTGGRGRLGRSWSTPRGNLAVSVILRPPVPPHKAPLITLLGAVAAAAAIRRHLGLEAGIKWPNDVLIKGRKVAGLLTEMSAEPDRIRHVVLGIGLNVNAELAALPSEVRDRSTTLAAEAGKAVDRNAFLRALLEELDGWYARFLRREADVLAQWTELNVTLGRRVAVSGAGPVLEGTAEALDEEGRLVLRLDDGTLRRVAAGDVTVVKR